MEQIANNERSRVLTNASLRAANYMNLSNTELSHVLGVSPSTITRMQQGSYEIAQGSKPWEMASLLTRLYRGLDAIMAGDNVSLLSWIDSPNNHLRAVPKELIMSTEGLVRTLAYVDSSRARV